MAKTKIMPRALNVGKTQKFNDDVQQAMETFDDQIQSMNSQVCKKVYKDFITNYRDAMVPIWNLARFASVDTVLNTVAYKELTALATLKRKLQQKPPTAAVVKEQAAIPDLEAITETLKAKFPDQSLPGTEVCNKISSVFSQLATASKMYGEAAAGIAELANLVIPDQLTMLLCAATMPAIQVVVPEKLIPPLATPPPAQAKSSTTIGRMELIKQMKKMVLPNPESPELETCDKNAAMCVLATATYYKLEHHLFKEMLSWADIATAFKCNNSQVAKAVTGITYKSGPHHYKGRGAKTATKRACDSTDPGPGTSKAKRTEKHTTQKVAEDTLSSSSSSSSSDLPIGLAP